MKNIIILLIVIFINITSLFSQDIIDPIRLFDKTQSWTEGGTTLNLNEIFFNNKEFILGWNWGCPGERLDQALNVKYYHGYPSLFKDEVIDTARLIDPLQMVGGRNCHALLNSFSVSYEPTLFVDSSSNFTPRENDKTGAVFGWLDKERVTITTNPNDQDFNRIVLHTYNFDPLEPPVKVLSNVWPNNILHYLNYNTTTTRDINGYLDVENNVPATGQPVEDCEFINGKRMYLSINLHSIGDIASLGDDVVVLQIKLPYKVFHRYSDPCGDKYEYNSTRYAYFDSIPKTVGIPQVYNISGSRQDFRGQARYLSGSTTNELNITAKMLKDLITTNGNITLSAHLRFENTTNPLDPPIGTGINQILEPDWYDHPDLNYYIKDMDVEVFYTHEIDLAIDWIRLETPRARAIYHGKYDNIMKDMIFDYLSDLGTTTRNGRVFRFYANDEFLPGIWGANRYFNLLVDTLAAAEVSHVLNPPSQFSHATLFKEFWTGDNITWKMPVALPYYKMGAEWNGQYPQPNWSLITTRFGYAGNKNNFNGILTDHIDFNSINSGYETLLYGAYGRLDGTKVDDSTPSAQLPSQLNWNDDNLNLFYNSDYCTQNSTYQWNYAPLFNIEKSLFQYYHNKGLIFNDNPWFANLWINTEGWSLKYGKNGQVVALGPGSARPATDREINTCISLPLILGAKGIFYYYKNKYPNNDMMLEILGIQRYYSTINGTGLDYIFNDSLGGDYIIPNSGDPNFIDIYKPSLLGNERYSFSELGVDSNHIFIGLKSIRYELLKLNSIIKASEDKLLGLELQAWFGKGFRNWYVQDPNIEETSLMGNFINYNNIKTRKLWQPNALGGGYVPTAYEVDTLRFFDVTILKNKDKELTESYVLGVQNRRTDPLIWTCAPGNNWQLDFVPSAKFDRLCLEVDSTYWKSMYWLRLGCREISIPLVNPTNKPNSEVAFKITELGYDNEELKKEYWFTPPFNHLIDTNCLVGDTLRLRLLPGQGKMLNVEIISTQDLVGGQLDYSNQTKLVAFPCDSNFDANGTDTMGRIRYHMVYSRRTSPMSNSSNVYYKRSYPMNRLEKNIQWESEHQLNNKVFALICSQECDTITNLSCNYPSLVVRCDTVGSDIIPKVYAVFQGSSSMCPGNTKLRIIESVFAANPTNLNIPVAIQIGEVNAVKTSPENPIWGIPVINASYHGNYYAWNDSLLGIVAGYKTPGQEGWIMNSQKTHFQGLTSSGGHSPKAYHPSLNTYSTISDNEMDCALVWEESPNGVYRDWFNQIFYTRLKYCPNTGMIHYVPQTWGHPSGWYHQAIYVDSNRIVRLDDTNHMVVLNHLPMIHRDVDYYNANLVSEYNGMWPRIFKNDRVYWQGRATWSNNLQGIFMKFISIGDNLMQDNCIPYSPNNWLVEGTPAILGVTKDLAHPNVVQGKLVKKYHIVNPQTKILYYSFDSADNDSVAVINFVEYPHDNSYIADVPRTADIWQINHSYFSLFYGPDHYIYEWDFASHAPNAHRIGSKGKYSHLAHIPYINNDKTWEYGHRIFESTDISGLIPTIKSYDYLLYKKSYEKDRNYEFFGFIDTYGNRTLLSPIYLTVDGREHAIIPKLDKEHKIYSDTLYSDWLEIASYQDIDMLHFGSNKKCLDLKLQRKSDNKFFSIQTDKQSERFDYTKHSVHLINGKSKEYRFAWIKSTKSNFTEMTILGLPPINEMVKDEMLGKTSINVDENYLDLSEDITSEIPESSSLFIYPNPAKEKIVIFYEQENKSNINISICGMLGNTIKCVFTGEIDKGKYQYSVNTKDIPAGIYFIRAEGHNKTLVKKLVIE